MKGKKVMTALALCALLSGLTAYAEAPYTDLGSLKSRAAVDYLYDNQCLDFVAGRTFAPQQILTRGELAQLIYSTSVSMPAGEETFSDAATPKAGDAMSAVSAQGILSGYKDGTFQPDKPVTREEFASVLYKYLQYCGLDDVDNRQPAFADADLIAPENSAAVKYLQEKNLLTTSDNYFHPQEGMTRIAAVEAIYHMLHSDADYVSHVDVESQVIRSLNAEYGSLPEYFRQGTLYWDGDTLVLGLKGGPRMFLKQRLKRDVTRSDVIEFRQAHLARADYDQLMNRAINCVVSEEGVQNYLGAIPDFKNEKIDLILRRPVAETTKEKLISRIGKGIIRFHDARSLAERPAVLGEGEVTEIKTAGETTEKDEMMSYSPLYDQATNEAVRSVINDAMK